MHFNHAMYEFIILSAVTRNPVFGYFIPIAILFNTYTRSTIIPISVEPILYLTKKETHTERFPNFLENNNKFIY